MKLLHTADWHVGKTIKGQSRIGEHAAVLADVVRIVDEEAVDVVLVVGDLYETAAPSPEAEALVLKTILDLRDTSAQVVVLAGNHDNTHRFDAVRPVFQALGVTVMGAPRRPHDGGVLEVECRSGGSARVALVPFCSQRSIIRADQLMGLDVAQLAGTYDERMRQLIGALTEAFTGDAVNIVAAHCMVTGALLGGGERSAQTYMDYWVGAQAFPAHAHYVALGHLHRTQQIAGGAPIWYSGSPLQVDFGELEGPSHVLVVEATPANPAQVSHREVGGSRRLRTLKGTLEQLRAHAGETGNDYLRVFVEEPARAGLAETVQDMLGPGVVEVRVQPAEAGAPKGGGDADHTGKTPHELFAMYLAQEGIDDARVTELFATLLDEETR